MYSPHHDPEPQNCQQTTNGNPAFVLFCKLFETRTTWFRAVLARLWLDKKKKRCTSLSRGETTPSSHGKLSRERRASLLSTFKTIHTTKWHKRKEGTPSIHKHTMSKHQNSEGDWPAKTTQKGSPLTFLLLHFSQHNPLLSCHSPSTVREGLISWHSMSRAVWQLKATFPSSQSCTQREILPPGPNNPMTCNATLHTLSSREPQEDTLSSSDRASPSLPHIGPAHFPFIQDQGQDIHLLRLFLLPRLSARQ